MGLVNPSPGKIADIKIKLKGRPPIDFGVKFERLALGSGVQVGGLKWHQAGTDVFGIAHVRAMSHELIRSFATKLPQKFPDTIHSTQVTTNVERYASPRTAGRYLNPHQMSYFGKRQ